MFLKFIKENFDEYSLKARIIPSIVVLLPIGVFLHSFFGSTSLISVFGTTFSVFFLTFLISDVVRNLGKKMEGDIFKDELRFPTTDYLFNKRSKISSDKKARIYKKIKKDFGIELGLESSNEREERLKIKEAVGEIRQVLKNGRLLLQMNIRYGLWRNILGFSKISATFSLLLSVFYIFQGEFTYVVVCFIFATLYSLLYFFRQNLLNFFGHQYAEQLFLEYLSLE